MLAILGKVRFKEICYGDVVCEDANVYPPRQLFAICLLT